MFIRKGVIYKSDNSNYVYIGPQDPTKLLLPIQFSNDIPRRDQVIARTINTRYSHIPERQEKALQDKAQDWLVAQQSRGESTVGNIEAYEDRNYDISDLLNKTDLIDEKHVQV